MSTPEALYCIHCKKPQKCSSVKASTTTFTSKRNKVPCSRESWQATCSVCSKNVRAFKKKEAKAEAAATPPAK